MVHICHTEKEYAERQIPEAERRSYTGQLERNLSLSKWLVTASREDIIDIWGDPITQGETVFWEIPAEPYQYVSKEIFEENGKFCFAIGTRIVELIVEENKTVTSNNERTIRRTIQMGQSQYKPKR